MLGLTKHLQAGHWGGSRTLSLRSVVAVHAEAQQGIGGFAALPGPGQQIALGTIADSVGLSLCAAGFVRATLCLETRETTFKAWQAEAEASA